MSISGISSYSTADYASLASGRRISSAADDAAGLSISEKLTTESNGLSVASSNAEAGNDLLKVADGALSGIADSLQRIRELGVQASNTAVNSPSDISAMQKEIEGLKQSIQDTAKGTSFNTKKLLDGSMADLNLATNPQGGGKTIQLADSTLESLGIADFDVTGDFDLQTIDDAIAKVSEARSSIGAQSNSLTAAVRSNDYTAQNTTAANSRLADEDYGAKLTEQKKDEAMEKYRIFSLNAQRENEAGILKLFQQ